MKPLVIVITDKTLGKINAFCTAVYNSAFSPEVAAAKLKDLPMLDAIALYQAGGCEAKKMVVFA